MRSLRARLLAAVLALAAVGLVALAAITYAEQRSFLIDRLDDQARAALVGIGRALDDGDFGGRSPGDQEPPRGGPGGPPSGTYGERRDADGRVVDSTVFAVGTSSAAPALPADVPLRRVFTVDAASGGERYRVYADRTRGGDGIDIVAVPMREVDQTLDRLALVEALVVAGVLLALGIAAWVVVRVGLLPLDRMGATAGAIAGGDLSRRVEPADPRSEVGRLGLALNAMLGRLEGAFAQRQESEDRLRRFLADASHELRTPLASIRGYAELFRIGAARSQDDVDKAMRRIEEEAARMGVLVEDLLTLARLDQVPDAPPHARVDIAALARDAVDDARAVDPSRAIAIEGARVANVLGDAHQLRQVLANLLRNALVHTPVGTPIEVAVFADDDRVAIVVRDHGPGLPDGDAAALFERFWRAAGGRERGRAGAGLGLAIVAAIVASHGGEVAAANAPGGGAVFTVELPQAPRAD